MLLLPVRSTIPRDFSWADTQFPSSRSFRRDPFDLFLILQGTVDHIVKSNAIAQTLRGRLHHEHDEQIFTGIHPEGRTACTAPEIFADTAELWRNARFCAHRKAKPKAEPRPGQIKRPGHDTCCRADLIRSHRCDALGAQIMMLVEPAAAQEHLQEASVIRRGRHHAATAGFPSPRHAWVTEFCVPAYGPIVCERLGDARPF